MNTEKVRPVLITEGVTGQSLTVECLKITGHAPRAGEYLVREWAKAGLHKSSAVRISKKLELPVSKVIKRIGKLQPLDIIGVEGAIEQQSKIAI